MACLGTESAIAVDDALGCVQCTRGDEADDADGKRDDDAASVPLDSSAPKDLANRDAKAAAPAATACSRRSSCCCLLLLRCDPWLALAPKPASCFANCKSRAAFVNGTALPSSLNINGCQSGWSASWSISVLLSRSFPTLFRRPWTRACDTSSPT